MNWSAVAFDWNQVRAFLATVEEGSLSAAARALGQSQPTLGRQVTALEASLGVVLFERVGRSLVLTNSGQGLLGHVRAMRDSAAQISLAASGQSQSVEGHVCISASDAISAYMLPPLLQRLRAEAPGISIEILASNAISDLQRREADIAIRHVRPDQPDLIARLLRQGNANFYGATFYLNARGRPANVSDLRSHDIIGFQPLPRFVEHVQTFGIPIVAEQCWLSSESGVATWEMVRQGLGLGIMLADIAEATPQVERVLPDIASIPVPLWLTTHRELLTSRRIRLVYDFLGRALARPPDHTIEARKSVR